MYHAYIVCPIIMVFISDSNIPKWEGFNRSIKIVSCYSCLPCCMGRLSTRNSSSKVSWTSWSLCVNVWSRWGSKFWRRACAVAAVAISRCSISVRVWAHGFICIYWTSYIKLYLWHNSSLFMADCKHDDLGAHVISYMQHLHSTPFPCSIPPHVLFIIEVQSIKCWRLFHEAKLLVWQDEAVGVKLIALQSSWYTSCMQHA